MRVKSFPTCLLLALLLLSPLLKSFADPLSVSTNKYEYVRGETVSISISATPNCDLGLTIRNPAGSVVFLKQLKADSGGSASTSYKIPSDALYGTYTIDVARYGESGSCTFRVVQQVAPPPPPPPPGKESSSMTISIDKNLIMLGENVTVRGILSPGLDVTIRLRLTCPNGSEATVSVPAPYGVFTYVFKPDAAGLWSIRAAWDGNDQYEGCLSNAVSLLVRGAVSLQIIAAPSITGVGGIVILYVSSAPRLENKPLTLSYITNRTSMWTTIGTFQTDSEGVLARLFTPSETGEYMFRVEWVGDPTYTPASANSSRVLVMAEPLTLEDIINMLRRLKALEKLLEEKEKELENYGNTISGLRKNIEDLQTELGSAQSRISSLEEQLAEAQSRISEAESRVQFTTILGLVAGVLIGLILGYFAFRRRSRTGFPLPPE